VLSEFFLVRPGRAKVGARGLLGIRVPCLGRGSEGVMLVFGVVFGIVVGVCWLIESIAMVVSEWDEI
jgi:hypothetical protein